MTIPLPGLVVGSLFILAGLLFFFAKITETKHPPSSELEEQYMDDPP